MLRSVCDHTSQKNSGDGYYSNYQTKACPHVQAHGLREFPYSGRSEAGNDQDNSQK